MPRSEYELFNSYHLFNLCPLNPHFLGGMSGNVKNKLVRPFPVGCTDTNSDQDDVFLSEENVIQEECSQYYGSSQSECDLLAMSLPVYAISHIILDDVPVRDMESHQEVKAPGAQLKEQDFLCLPPG